jgi:hypothetical protein
MKRIKFAFPVFFCAIVLLFFMSGQTIKGQTAMKSFAEIPDSVNAIITVSCVPCHTSDGGLMSKSKLNFSEWDKYTPDKKKAKSAKMVSELEKGSMPPKKAREKNPELIPTPEQISVIKRWSLTFTSDSI